MRRSRDAAGDLVVRFGVALLDAYLEFLAVRSRPNTVVAVGYDLKVFFTVVGKPPRQVGAADCAGVRDRAVCRRPAASAAARRRGWSVGADGPAQVVERVRAVRVPAGPAGARASPLPSWTPSRALRLDETEHAYLHAVARPANRPGRKDAPRVRPAIQLLLDSMDRSPAAVVGPRLDILAWNALYDALFGYSRVAPRARSIARHVFLGPACRDLYPDWAAMAAECVAHLRRVSGHRREDRQLAELVGELSVKSEDFRHL